VKIRFHKQFEKHFQKLPKNIQIKTITGMKKFMKNPFDKTLRNHSLTGRLSGKRAFSITTDLRIIFEEQENYFLVLFFDIGTHNQIY
jgi:addiction module RelE/StbE family toxin